VKPRARVSSALRHSEPDRVPVDFGGAVSSIMKTPYHNLCRYMNISPKDTRYSNFNTVLNIDERILEEFAIDFRRVWLGEPVKKKPFKDENGFLTDIYGIKKKTVGEYTETVLFPLAGANMHDISRYQFPDPEDRGWLLGVKENARKLYEETDYAVVLGMGADGIFESGTYLFGFEDFLLKLLSEKKLVNYFFDKLLEYLTCLYSRVLKEIGEYLDIVEFGDDMANQLQLFFSPDIYRALIKPRHNAFFGTIKKFTDAKIFLHCCGSVIELVEDLIDVGIDILNPVQPYAKGMRARDLKRKFGKRICFHGGIDEQYYLPRAGMDEFTSEVKRVIDEFCPEGGFILAPAHNFQSDTSPEKIIKLYELAAYYGNYKRG
jgi:uroporphyrinogen decarboxylase